MADAAHVWLIKEGETLPLTAGSLPMRTGLLAAELARRGHSVTWWSSTFNHFRKTWIREHDTQARVGAGIDLHLLHAGGYQKNISLARLYYLARLTRRFSFAVQKVRTPDVIVVAFPSVGLVRAVAAYAKPRGVPVIVDVRDFWPDNLVVRCPPPSRAVIRQLLAPEYARARGALTRAQSLVAISEGGLRWALALASRPRGEYDCVFPIAYPRLGPSLESPSPNLQALLRALEGKVLFAFVGTFGHSYELDLVARVAERVLKAGLREAHFVLAGEGIQLAALKQRAAHLANVTFTGWLDRVDVSALLGRADVGLVPLHSVNDTVSNKLVLYLSAGLPVLSSLRGEMEELIVEREIGCNYPIGDAQALFALVMELAKDGEWRRRMAGAARRVFEERFMADTVYRAYADHVERMRRK